MKWKHIRDEFLNVKESIDMNSFKDVKSSFGGYLALLSQREISLGHLDEKLASRITSGGNGLSDKLCPKGQRAQ